MSSFKVTYILIISVLFLSACSSKFADENVPSSLKKDSDSTALIASEDDFSNICITPSETFAYSVFPHDDLIQIEKTLPPDPWQLVAPIMSDFEFGNVYGIRSQKDHQEIWIGFLYYDKFLTYEPASKEWGEVEIGLGDQIQIEELFFTQDGSVYAVPYMRDRDKSSEMSVLSKYNEETKTFEFIELLQEIPLASNENAYEVTQVAYDEQRELFWFLVPDDAIYSFVPETQKLKKYIDIPEEEIFDISKVRVSSTGKVYFQSRLKTVTTNEDMRLVEFDPDLNSIRKYGMPLTPWPLGNGIYIDHSDRIWFSAVGWMDSDRRWYQMIPSPIFISNVRFSGMDYRWQSPEIYLESKDGRLWMGFDHGMVWLDPDEEEWCWFTTEESNIHEDKDGNLWMIAYDSLYKLPIND